jgi:hypothetical protein
MKHLIFFLALVIGAFAAPDDLILSQAKNPGPGNIQRNLPAVAGGFMQFGNDLIPKTLSLTTLTYAASTDIVMTNNLNTVTLTGDITFTTSSKASGLYTTVRVVGDGSNRTLAFPGTWVWVGSVAPTTLVANKVGVLSLICFGATDADVVASWVSSL